MIMKLIPAGVRTILFIRTAIKRPSAYQTILLHCVICNVYKLHITLYAIYLQVQAFTNDYSRLQRSNFLIESRHLVRNIID